MSKIVHDETKLRDLGFEMGKLLAEFMLKEITASTIDATDVSAFSSRCAACVHGVREDMQGDGYSEREIGVYVDACLARMKEMFSAYRGALNATIDQRGRN